MAGDQFCTKVSGEHPILGVGEAGYVRHSGRQWGGSVVSHSVCLARGYPAGGLRCRVQDAVLPLPLLQTLLS